MLLGIPEAFGQKFGYVDGAFILKKMPEYKEAQKELNAKAAEWQKEVEEKYAEVEQLEKEFNAEEILLPEDIRQERLDTIAARKKRALDYKKQVFGVEGLLFLKEQELIKPVQEKLFKAVEAVSLDERIDVMFDKSGAVTMLYLDTDHDYTDLVLEELGLGDPSDTVDNPRYKEKRKSQRRR